MTTLTDNNATWACTDINIKHRKKKKGKNKYSYIKWRYIGSGKVKNQGIRNWSSSRYMNKLNVATLLKVSLLAGILIQV